MNGDAGLRRACLAALALFCAARAALLERWLWTRLDGFYYYAGDDVSRLGAALQWASAPDLRPFADWLPLPMYLGGLLIRAGAEPQTAAAHLHIAASTATLALAGLTALAAFPGSPAAALLAAAALAFLPGFHKLSLSGQPEVELWLFASGAALSWALYRADGRRRWLALNAGCLWLASMTRYEAWLLVALFVALAAYEFRRRDEPAWLLPVYAAAAASYALFFVAYQESTLEHLRRPGAREPLTLSYRGVRLYFRRPVPDEEAANIMRSFHRLPLQAVLLSPPLSAAGAAAGAAAVLRRGPLAWLAALTAGLLAALTAVCGIFGAPLGDSRILVIFYVLLAPLIGAAGAAFLRGGRLAAAAGALACAAALGTLEKALPQPRGGARDPDAGPMALARAIRAVETAGGPRAVVLYELHERPPFVYANTAIEYAAPGRVVPDREVRVPAATAMLETEGNPSLFERPRAELKRFLRERGVNLVVAHSPRAAERLRGLARPIGREPPWTLYAVEAAGPGLSAYEAALAARRP